MIAKTTSITGWTVPDTGPWVAPFRLLSSCRCPPATRARRGGRRRRRQRRWRWWRQRRRRLLGV